MKGKACRISFMRWKIVKYNETNTIVPEKSKALYNLVKKDLKT